ncbi:hypothetical protein FDP41_013760 [Naegleria fowleri]|uniref:Ubiquitin-like domain-containing protein n=1 Tax=Naegleria fowleri TaxID=5763 RepID=A0A6A5BZT3_NAEFO|nr:uncharacterized protein FDP41_013760 [Naegleria fowleri]KAF0980111.1 hypothetical protein FDP41_013760 [Naegleria fowleri]
MSSNKTKDKPKKVSSESDSSDDSSSDDDLFHHKAAKSYKQSTWKYSHAPPTSPSEPNKKKNLLKLQKLPLQTQKNAKRNSVTDEDSKKRKPNEELKKIILEQKKQRREQKRTKHTHSSSIPPEDIISIDDDLTPTTVENAPSSSSTFPTATTSTLFGNMGSTFSSSSTMFVGNRALRKRKTAYRTVSQKQELRPELKLDDSTLIDQEEEADNKGEKIIIRVRWNEKPSTAIEIIDDTATKVTINVRAKEKTFPVKISTTDKFSKIAKYVSKQLNVDDSKVKLLLDGMVLDLNDTPEDHDMEDEDIIDCQKTK